MKSLLTFFIVCAFLVGSSFAQQQAGPPPQPKPDPPKFVPPTQRIRDAKTAFVKNGGGSELSFNVIQGGIEGWARYMLVDSPSKADIIIEIVSPEETSASVSSKVTNESGQDEQSTTSSRSITVTNIKLTVYDARNKVALWSTSEQPKGAGFSKNSQNDKLIEAAQRLLHRFRKFVEPEVNE